MNRLDVLPIHPSSFILHDSSFILVPGFPPMVRALPAVLAFVVVLLSGLGHGLWTARWTASNEPGASAARLANIPLTVGEWEGQELQLDAIQVAKADLAGYLMRRYVRRNGSQVVILLACGRPGPISVHTPDVCYGGTGYQMMGAPARESVAGDTSPTPEFFRADFGRPEQTTPERLRIYWAWSTTGAWQAPDSPRLVFGRYPALYKLYVVYTLPGTQKLEEDPCRDFIRDLLPELQRHLFPAP
jgi:hypothetical protein